MRLKYIIYIILFFLFNNAYGLAPKSDINRTLSIRIIAKQSLDINNIFKGQAWGLIDNSQYFSSEILNFINNIFSNMEDRIELQFDLDESLLSHIENPDDIISKSMEINLSRKEIIDRFLFDFATNIKENVEGKYSFNIKIVKNEAGLSGIQIELINPEKINDLTGVLNGKSIRLNYEAQYYDENIEENVIPPRGVFFILLKTIALKFNGFIFEIESNGSKYRFYRDHTEEMKVRSRKTKITFTIFPVSSSNNCHEISV